MVSDAHGGPVDGLARRQVVRLRGALTSESSAYLLELLRSVQPAPGEVVVDLSRVTSVDRSGAAILLDAYVATVIRHRAFAVSGPSAACQRSLERFGVLDVVELINRDEQISQQGESHHDVCAGRDG